MLDVLIINSIESMALVILKNCLRNAGFNADYYASVNYNDLLNKIISIKPKILAISWNFDPIIYEVLLQLDKLKEKLPELKIIVGGYGATNDLENISQYELIDAIIVGEGDEIIINATTDLLNGLNEKLPKIYKPIRIPTLIDYDYNNNILINNNCLYTVTSRNCIKGKNRCWYCTCFTDGFRFLDLEKIIESIKINLTPNITQIALADAEVTHDRVNRLWNEFHLPITCFMMASDLNNLDKSVKGCHFIVGVDYYVPNKNGNFINSRIIKNIKECSKNNKVSISTVCDEECLEQENTIKILKKISNNNKNIDVTFPKLVRYPGTDNIKLNKNIYLNGINFEEEFTDIGRTGNFNTNGQDQTSFTTWQEAFDIE